MARFNTKTTGTKTTNLAGGVGYAQSPEMELVSILLTSFVKDQYYRDADMTMNRLKELISKVDPKFAAQAAIFTRHEFGMRSISHVLAGELVKYASGQPWARSFYDKIVRRPDDMLEITSYYFGAGNKRLSSAMQFGFRKAIEKFDEYQLAKYRGENRDVSLVDMVRLVRPASTSPNINAIGKLINGELKSTETWEAKLTTAGQTAETVEEKQELKKEAWTELVMSRKIGYFALLRNLRNIMNQAPDVIDVACELLVNPKLIKTSLVLPFRYLTAINEIDTSSAIGRKVVAAIHKAFEISLDNIPDLPNTLVVVDNSGSMSGDWGNGGNHFGWMTHAQLGAMFGMMVAKRSNADLMEFGTTARYIQYSLNEDVFKFAKNFKQLNDVGHGTNFHSIFDTANKKYDRIIIFSDMQGWQGGNKISPGSMALAAYNQKYNANPYIYSFDLNGYGSLQFPASKVFQLAGFSDKVFDLIGKLEEDPATLVKKIKAVEL